jgi:hypothetical protein
MVEINAHSLFGKHKFIMEQILIDQFTDDVEKVIALVEPIAIGLPIPLEKLPLGLRQKKIRQNLGKAKEKLENLGV